MTTTKEVVSEWIKLHATDTPQGTRWRRKSGDPQPQTKSELPIDGWHIARTTGEDLRARSIAVEVKHETLPANRTRLLAAPVDLLPVLAVDLLACTVGAGIVL